jgi:uncharacterized protein
MTPRTALGTIFAAVLLPLSVFAYTSPGRPSGFVNDFAGILAPQEKTALESKLGGFKAQTSNEISVVTVPNLGGDTVENYAVELFHEWAIGEKGKDNGILLLFAMEEHDIRIEVGYGLEGALTDAQSSWIINNTIIPAFKDGKYYAGIDGAVDSVIGATKGEYVPSETNQTNNNKQTVDWFWLVFFVPVWLASILGRSKSWWAGGVLGGIAGIVIGFVKGFLYWGIVSIAILIPIGLLFDFVVSRSYAKGKQSGHFPWWIGGGGFGGSGGFGGGGGFGGFGGGGSGGGGASGRW